MGTPKLSKYTEQSMSLPERQRRRRLLRLHAHRAALVHLAAIGDAAPVGRHATQLRLTGGGSDAQFVSVVCVVAAAAVQRVLRLGPVALEHLQLVMGGVALKGCWI